MDAWAADQGIGTSSIIKLMGDPYGELTEKLDMELTHSGPKSVGLINRCKRFALYMEDGSVKIAKVAEAEDVSAIDFVSELSFHGTWLRETVRSRTSPLFPMRDLLTDARVSAASCSLSSRTVLQRSSA